MFAFRLHNLVSPTIYSESVKTFTDFSVIKATEISVGYWFKYKCLKNIIIIFLIINIRDKVVNFGGKKLKTKGVTNLNQL